MESSSIDDSVEYLSVVVDRACIAEVDGGLRVVSIPREDIRRVHLATGSGAERPITQLILGLIVIGLGVALTGPIVGWFMYGGTIDIAMAFAPGLLVIGGWLLRGVVRRRRYLRVQTLLGDRKVVFRGRPDLQRLEEFVDQARRFGYQIEGK